MKKFIYGALALASVASLASCSSDEPFGQQPNDGKVTFTVTMPGQNTRFAEGTTVDQLYYTVFQNGTKVLDGVEKWPTGSLSTTVTLQLVSNQSYDVVFFADTKAAETAGVYSYDKTSAQFNVTYSDAMINSDAYDAFVKKEAIVADGGEKKVLLYRPFAQVNIGSDDLGVDAVTTYRLENFSSTLTIQPTNLLSGMNFLSGATTAQTAAVTFALENFSNLPGDKFPVDGTPEKPYKYIEMNYLLVPAAPTAAAADWSNLLNVTYTINGKGENNVVNQLNLSSMPTRQNYQTNVYGSLLTTQQKFDVTIVPAFDGNFNPAPDAVVSTVEEFSDALTKCNKITVPEGVVLDLSTLPAQTFNRPINLVINGTLNNAKNQFAFNSDFTLSGTGTINLLPSATSGGTDGFSFISIGRNVTGKISGITINGNDPTSEREYIINGTSFNELTIENCNISSSKICMDLRYGKTANIVNCVFEGYPSTVLSAPVALRIDNATMTNCTVKGLYTAVRIDSDVMTIEGGNFIATKSGNSMGVLEAARDVNLTVNNAHLYAGATVFDCLMGNYTAKFTNCSVNKKISPLHETSNTVEYQDVTETVNILGTDYTFTKIANGEVTYIAE